MKRQAIRGTLGERPEDETMSFRMSSYEENLLTECAEQSAYRSRSAYVRDQAIGWAQGCSITAKAGLILHWAAAHRKTNVGHEKWAQLRNLTAEFFNPECISGLAGRSKCRNPCSEDAAGSKSSPDLRDTSCPEDPLQKALGLVQRHLLAVEPLPLQLLKRQLIKMRRFDEVKKVTASPSGPKRPGHRNLETGWAREVRRQVLAGSESKDGCYALKSVRMAPAERAAAEKNFSESGYASLSGYARNCILGWDRDPLVVSRAAVVVTWLASWAGRPIDREDWKSLDRAMGDAFSTDHLPGADTTRQDLQVAEEHLLKAEKERVAEDTGIPVL